jgi:hypothetical protein
MPNIIIHPTRRNVDSEPQLGLRAGDDGRYPPNALFNIACLNCTQHLRLALMVAST